MDSERANPLHTGAGRRPRAGEAVDLAIIGGGLAGLIAANLAVDAGLSVRLIEKRRTVGGRAGCPAGTASPSTRAPTPSTWRRARFGAPLARCRTLRYATGLEGRHGQHRLDHGLLPQGPGSLLRTPLLSLRAKRGLAMLMARLSRMDGSSLASVTVDRWLDDLTDLADLRTLLCGLVNLSTYNAASDIASADAALAQLQMALDDGVIYLDGGWSQIVDALVDRLERPSAGRAGADFARIEGQVADIAGPWPADDAGQPTEPDRPSYLCRTADGSVTAANVVVAVGLPAVADRLIGGAGVVAKAGPPVEAAVLDLGLDKPPPVDVFLSLDRALYQSTHSLAAGMAPAGRALVTVARYIRPHDDIGVEQGKRLLLQHAAASGIDLRDVVMDRYLHRLTVTGGMPTAANGVWPAGHRWWSAAGPGCSWPATGSVGGACWPMPPRPAPSRRSVRWWPGSIARRPDLRPRQRCDDHGQGRAAMTRSRGSAAMTTVEAALR